MHSNVTIKNVSWPHFSWATLYMYIYVMVASEVKLFGLQVHSFGHYRVSSWSMKSALISLSGLHSFF